MKNVRIEEKCNCSLMSRSKIILLKKQKTKLALINSMKEIEMSQIFNLAFHLTKWSKEIVVTMTRMKNFW